MKTKNNLKLISAVLISLMLLLMAGCFTPAQLHTGFTLVDAGMKSTAAGLRAFNPSLADQFLKWEPLVPIVQIAFDDYFASPNATTAAKAQSALAALSSAIDKAYTVANVDPKTLAIVEGVIAIANTWIIIAQGHLPPSAAPQSAIFRPSNPLPFVNGTQSPNDLKKFFNERAKANGLKKI